MVSITVAIAAISYVHFTGIAVSSDEDLTTLAMNIYFKDDDANTVVWEVSGLEGATLKEENYDAKLLHNNGTKDEGATILFQDIISPGYVNEGDTFKVKASEDGYFVFLITNSKSGNTIYKSALTIY